MRGAVAGGPAVQRHFPRSHTQNPNPSPNARARRLPAAAFSSLPQVRFRALNSRNIPVSMPEEEVDETTTLAMFWDCARGR